MVHSSAVRRVSPRLAALLASSVLAGLPGMALAQNAVAQDAAAPAAAPAPAVAPAPVPEAPPVEQIITSIDVRGNQRLERDTILSYIRMRPGQVYSQALADQALKDLYATELMSDVQIRNDAGAVVIVVKENPVINRFIYEGYKRLKED